ncbi:MAG: hypothetical protein GY898_23110 [Proteobacteria bacterium]|nr:hypothetical protein [Pseudomonadota bacterium]
MSRPRQLTELTAGRRQELLVALREVEQRLKAYPEPNPRPVLEDACRALGGHPDRFRAWVDGYTAGLVQKVPDLVDDTLRSIARIAEGLLP